MKKGRSTVWYLEQVFADVLNIVYFHLIGTKDERQKKNLKSKMKRLCFENNAHLIDGIL